jgi:hypothetical protein
MLAALALTFGCGGSGTETPVVVEETVVEAAPAEEAVVEARHDVLYVCSCGPECDCGAVALEAGKCGCGSDLVQTHMLKVDGNVASVCTCGKDCTCELDAQDPTKCGCGSPVRQVSFEGKGLYYCNCGGSCSCNFVATEPGKCACGMDLVTS